MVPQIAASQGFQQRTRVIVLYVDNRCAAYASVGWFIDRQLKACVRVMSEMEAGLRTALGTTIESSGEIVEPQ